MVAEIEMSLHLHIVNALLNVCLLSSLHSLSKVKAFSALRLSVRSLILSFLIGIDKIFV